ncbi:hypothetical protein HK096_000747 [Nowakowskiella sp. JEL0078]|nr:hypothetical protein HK096_000747 [Nowakowskiella sp. JEL0078]
MITRNFGNEYPTANTEDLEIDRVPTLPLYERSSADPHSAISVEIGTIYPEASSKRLKLPTYKDCVA